VATAARRGMGARVTKCRTVLIFECSAGIFCRAYTLYRGVEIASNNMKGSS
jgi:hypothetical protein